MDKSDGSEKENAAAIDGALLSPWFPCGLVRKIIFFGLLIFGIFGIYSNGNWFHYIAILFAAFLSPRAVGEVVFFLGRIVGKIEQYFHIK